MALCNIMSPHANGRLSSSLPAPLKRGNNHHLSSARRSVGSRIFSSANELYDAQLNKSNSHQNITSLTDVVNYVTSNMEVYGSRFARPMEVLSRSVDPKDGPDLASVYLDQSAIYIAMPLVPAVTELIMSELLFLAARDPKAPIIVYINSTGTTRADGQMVALESEGFAVYDVLTSVPNEVHTILVGQAIGHACLLLAAGTKGHRYMNAHSLAMLEQPKMPSYGQMRASNLTVNVDEAIYQRKHFMELISKHTGRSLETVSEVMETSFYMNATTAIEFGVADKIIHRENRGKPIEYLSAEEWRTRYESPHMSPSMDILF